MQKPKLTIFYQFDLWNSSIGGIQTVIRHFVKYAPPEFVVRLVGIGSDAALPMARWHSLEFEGQPVQFFPLFNLQNDDTRQLVPTSVKYTLALLGKNLDSDFLHFHRLEPALAAFPWQGDKTLFVHNDIRQKIQANQKGGILWQRFPQAYFALERLVVKQFDQIFSCNSESAQLYRHCYPAIASRVTCIRNTVDSEIFYPLSASQRHQQRQQLAQTLGLPATTRFLLFAGRLHPQKDPLLLLQAMAVLNEPDTHLLIAGEGELTDAVRIEVQRLNLSQQVTLLGAVAPAQLAGFYQLSHVFVLSSAYEGLPIAVLESLACGTPIVTTRAGETPNLLLPGSGVVCEARTPAAIAQGIREVLQYSQHDAADACIRAAQPYHARSVIGEVYSNMLQRWQARCPHQNAASPTQELQI